MFGIFHEVVAAGHCRHPVHLVALSVDRQTGEILTTNDVRIACKDRRAVLCPSCAAVYKADAWFLVTAGLAGGKGMPATVAEHPRLFLTLTAPSFGEVHTIRDDGSCHPGRRDCEHGRSRTCTKRHAPDDDVRGSPLCDECFEWEDAVLWNAASSQLWNRTIERVRRLLATQQRLGRRELRRQVSIQYLRVAETQRRGLVHFHVVLRADGPEPASRPPQWLTADVFSSAVRQAVASTTVHLEMAPSARWGSQLELADLGALEADAARVAGYVAKYATKTTDDAFGLARRFRDQHDLALARASPHLKRLAQCAWDLGGQPEHEALRLREHAHTLGFTGQLLTKSRGFSTTFGALRAARADYVAIEFERTPADDAVYAYVDRGYSDPRAETLAELLTDWDAELRVERRRRRLELDSLEQTGNGCVTEPE